MAETGREAFERWLIKRWLITQPWSHVETPYIAMKRSIANDAWKAGGNARLDAAIAKLWEMISNEPKTIVARESDKVVALRQAIAALEEMKQ